MLQTELFQSLQIKLLIILFYPNLFESLLGPETGTLDTVAVGCTTFATLLVMGAAVSVGSRGLFRNASNSDRTFNNSASNS